MKMKKKQQQQQAVDYCSSLPSNGKKQGYHENFSSESKFPFGKKECLVVQKRGDL